MAPCSSFKALTLVMLCAGPDTGINVLNIPSFDLDGAVLPLLSWYLCHTFLLSNDGVIGKTYLGQ